MCCIITQNVHLMWNFNQLNLTYLGIISNVSPQIRLNHHIPKKNIFTGERSALPDTEKDFPSQTIMARPHYTIPRMTIRFVLVKNHRADTHLAPVTHCAREQTLGYQWFVVIPCPTVPTSVFRISALMTCRCQIIHICVPKLLRMILLFIRDFILESESVV